MSNLTLDDMRQEALLRLVRADAPITDRSTSAAMRYVRLDERRRNARHLRMLRAGPWSGWLWQQHRIARGEA